MLTPARPRASVLRGVVLALVLGLAGILLATPAQAADEPPVLLVGVTGRPLGRRHHADHPRAVEPVPRGLHRPGRRPERRVPVLPRRRLAGRLRPARAPRTCAPTTARAARCATRARTATCPAGTTTSAAADAESYGAQPGLLGDMLAAAGTPATGIGPGAAIALADAAGVPVGTHEILPDDQHRPHPRGARRPGRVPARRRRRAARCATRDTRRPARPSTPQPTASRAGRRASTSRRRPRCRRPTRSSSPRARRRRRSIDDRIGAAIAGAQRSGRDRPRRLARRLRPHRAPARRRDRARAERRRVRRQPADLGLHPAGRAHPDRRRDPDAARRHRARRAARPPSAAPRSCPDRPRPPRPPRVDRLLDIQRHATMVTRVSGAYSTRLVLVQAVLFLAAAIILTRKGRSDRPRCAPRCACCGSPRSPSPPRPSRRSSPTRCPWWRSDTPVTAFWWVLLGWVALITVVALVGPWRRNLLGPAGWSPASPSRCSCRRLHRARRSSSTPRWAPTGCSPRGSTG